MSAPTLRPVAPGDGAAVARLLGALSAHEGEDGDPVTAEVAERDVCAPSARVRGVIAEAGGAAVGLALWHWSWDADGAAAGSFLTDLYVVEDWRGRGLGRALMAAACAATQAEGGVFVQLTALRRNRAARAFYRSLCGAENELVVFSAAGEAFERLAAAGAVRSPGASR